MPDGDLTAALAAIKERADLRTAYVSILHSPYPPEVVTNRAAHSAGDVPPLLAAVEAVLGKHREFEGRCTHCWEFCTCVEDAQFAVTGDAVYKAAYDGWDRCPHGNEPWPCPTYRAVSAALLGEGGTGG